MTAASRNLATALAYLTVLSLWGSLTGPYLPHGMAGAGHLWGYISGFTGPVALVALGATVAYITLTAIDTTAHRP